MQTDGNLTYLLTQGFSSTILTRFWRRVVKSDGCWLFHGARLPKGYGRIGKGGKGSGYELAHRVSWLIHNGPIPDGKHVLHDCEGGDCPNCVHPGHLWIGTNADNIRDMIEKGRDVGNRRLSHEQIDEIRSLKTTLKGREIARRFGVTPGHISNILAGKIRNRISAGPKMPTALRGELFTSNQDQRPRD